MENQVHDPMQYGPHLHELLGSPEVVTKTNPWLDIAIPRLDNAMEEATPTPEKSNPFMERKEALVEQAALTIGIDKDKLAVLELPGHLEHLRETLLRLPERLEFKPGVNLIFGPNGSGKTTFARAINYAMVAEGYYQDSLRQGATEEEAESDRQKHFEMPTNRGTGLEEYLAAGVAPLIATTINVERLETNTHPRYCDVQAEVGRVVEIQKEMARDMGIQHRGDFIEYKGNAYSVNELRQHASENKSSRQTVDKLIGQFLDAAFTKKWGVKIEESDTLTGNEWEIPIEFKQPHQPSPDEYEEIGYPLERKYYPGVAFIDEPEAGIDVYRHLKLSENISSWAPKGSIMVCPSNSTELYRSEHPRLNLAEPEKGIHIPE